MSTSAPILNSLPTPLTVTDKNTMDNFNKLKKWADDLIKVLGVNLTSVTSQSNKTATLAGIISVPFINNVQTDTATDFILNVTFSVNVFIKRVYVRFDIPTASGSPTLAIRNATGGGGVGIGFALTSGYYGSGTGSIPVTAGNPLYMRVTNCTDLGSGNIVLEYS